MGTQVDLFRFFFHNICALLLGCLIGLERQWHRRNAGLRTNALVSLGAALFVSLSGLLFGTGDQSRIAAQVVSGIGFIGAGLLIKEGMNVSGLNTAATLWCAGAVGTLAGSGFVSEAAIGQASSLPPICCCAHSEMFSPEGLCRLATRTCSTPCGSSARGTRSSESVRWLCRRW